MSDYTLVRTLGCTQELFKALLHKPMTGDIRVGEPGSNIRTTTDV